MLLKLKNIYKETKFIDSLFAQKYNIKSKEIIQKYNLELLVEFGELANETKCFKFWSIKKVNKDKVLEEYIDCLFMILYFCNILDVELDEDFKEASNKNIIETFLNLYELGIEFSKNLSKEKIKEILVEILHLAKLLNFTYEDLEKETKEKSLIIQERLKSNY